MNSDKSRPSYRDIAAQVGCSVAAVSYALGNRPGVSDEKRQRICDVACRMGYQENPMVTAFMVYQRTKRPRGNTIRAIVAYMTSRDRGDDFYGHVHHSTHKQLFEGAHRACEEKGYLLEKFLWEDFRDRPHRLFSALRSRRVPGVIFAGNIPIHMDHDKEWRHFSVVSIASTSRGTEQLMFNASRADHYSNAWTIMDTLSEMGYDRVAFACTNQDWMVRQKYAHQSAILGWQARAGKRKFLIYWEKEWKKKDFLKWVERSKPQVLIASEHSPLEYLREAGYRIPEDIGFAHLDLDIHWNDLAGIRQNHFYVGKAAANMVIDQINSNAYGLPEAPRTVLTPGSWFAGPSVRRQTME